MSKLYPIEQQLSKRSKRVKFMNDLAYYNISDSHMDVEAAKEIVKLRELAEAALKYIDLNPCDPDIYPDQWEAWLKLEEKRNAGP